MFKFWTRRAPVNSIVTKGQTSIQGKNKKQADFKVKLENIITDMTLRLKITRH